VDLLQRLLWASEVPIPRSTPTPILVELTWLFAGEAAADDVEGELGKTELAVGYAPVEGVSVQLRKESFRPPTFFTKQNTL